MSQNEQIQMQETDGLQGRLKQRHVTMIAIAGVIGGGLFLGSGKGIATNGPATIVSYLFAAVLVVIVMRMLGEMASVRLRTTGSFKAYATEGLGPFWGYLTGWLYYIFWMYIIALEAFLGSELLHTLIPGLSIPMPITSLILTVLLTFTNCFSVKSYGEFEFWFACIKVTAICVFLGLGALILLNVIPAVPSPGFTNLINADNGGFMPNGFSSILLGILFIMFAFFGAEIGVIAVRESDNPNKAIHIVINSVVWRILIFYIGSIFLIACIVPMTDTEKLFNPYASIYDMVGIPYAGTIVNCVVLTSVLSCLNSALYTNSRMLFALAKEGDAPKYFLKLNKNGVPVRAVIASTTFSYILVLFRFVATEGFDIFTFIANATGAIALLIYTLIAVSQIQLRKKNPDLPYSIKVWAFPYLSWAIVGLMIITLFAMFLVPPEIGSTRIEVFSTLVLTALVIISYFIGVGKKRKANQTNN